MKMNSSKYSNDSSKKKAVTSSNLINYLSEQAKKDQIDHIIDQEFSYSKFMQQEKKNKNKSLYKDRDLKELYRLKSMLTTQE